MSPVIDGRYLELEEDSTREPHEKQTTISLDGDRAQFEIGSFRRVVFAKLLQRPEFEIKWLNVLDNDENEQTVDSLDAVASDPSLTIIGVTGTLPAGALTIGDPRQSDSHAKIVK